jgi:hypothetical protein
VNIASSVAASLVLLCSAGPALADDAAGRWALAGNLDGKNFALDCRFVQERQVLSGACVDDPHSDAPIKGSHVLRRGHATGKDVSWTYELSFLLIRFEVDYVGVRQGEHMSGTIGAAGRRGTFTASRLGP